MDRVEKLVTGAVDSTKSSRYKGKNIDSQEDAHSAAVADHSTAILRQVTNDSYNSSNKENSGVEDEARASENFSEDNEEGILLETGKTKAKETVDIVFPTPAGSAVLTVPILNISSKRARELLQQSGVQEIQHFRPAKLMKRETED